MIELKFGDKPIQVLTIEKDSLFVGLQMEFWASITGNIPIFFVYIQYVPIKWRRKNILSPRCVQQKYSKCLCQEMNIY